MTAQSVLDAVRRVEEAPLKDLVGVSVEDVEAQMDTLLEPQIDCASLYRRWEWSEYGRNHGLRHPVRFYQEGLVQAP